VDWYPEQRILVTGALYTITCARDVEHEASAHHFQIHFFTNLDLPFTDYARTSITTEGEVTMSLLAAKFESESGSVDIREAAGELLIGVSSQSAFPTNFHMRIIEAITFVSAKQTLWRVTHTVDGDKEILQLSSPRPQSKTKLRGPLYLATLTDRRMFWRLFAKYLEFSVRSAPEQGWHPCFVHIHNAIEASANSLDAWAVGLCVAVEGLANMIEVKDDASEKEKCCKIIEHVHAFLKSTSWLNQKVGNRARGLLNQLHQPRVIDRLSVLMERGRVSKDLVKAWQRLRPRAAHGAVIDMETVDKEVIETMLYDIGCVTTLLYQITFYLMGYDEGYTDYSKNGWPTGSVRTEVSGRPDGMST
jgi:hypothetical protein